MTDPDSPPSSTRGRIAFKREKTMNVKIDDLPPYRVAYMRSIARYGPETIPALWEKFIGWMERRGLLTADSLRLGIAHDSPRVVPPEQCRYDACVVVPDDFEADDAVTVSALPGWKVGMTEFVGTASEVRAAGDALWASLADSGRNPGSPFIEIYRGNSAVAGRPGVFKCRLCFALG
jgi:AraC family transcriptional regulator